MMKDRDLIDKSSDSFVSFVRYYKEHELTFIFNINSLDLGAVAYSFHFDVNTVTFRRKNNGPY